MRGGCPEIPSELCLFLIREIESARGDAMLRYQNIFVLDWRKLQRGGAMVHLFAGSQRWEHPDGKPSVSLDISRGFDLIDDALFHYLLELGRAGAIEALVGALPSGTFRFGVPTLTDEEKFKVDQDTVRRLHALMGLRNGDDKHKALHDWSKGWAHVVRSSEEVVQEGIGAVQKALSGGTQTLETRLCCMPCPHRTESAEDQAAASDAKATDHAIPLPGEMSEGEAEGAVEDDGGGVGAVQDNEWETPEADDPAFVLSESDKHRIKAENDKWKVIAEGCAEIAHEVVDIPMVEILPMKSAKAIVSALNRFYARLRSWGLPVYRLHSDRARELTDPLVTQWAAHRGIYKTTTVPEQPAGNGRAERLVGKLKQQARALLHSTDAGYALWPHAVRYSCEGLQRAQLHRLGMDVQPLVPFYSLVKFRARTWRDEQWGTRTPRLYATTLVYRNFVPEPEPPQGEASEAEEVLRLPETEGMLKAFQSCGGTALADLLKIAGEEGDTDEHTDEPASQPDARILLEGRRLASISAMREQEQALVKELQAGHVELAMSTAELLEQMDNSVSCIESLLESLSGQTTSEWESEGQSRSDISLRALDAESDVLQTKMVPIAEVAKDIENWKSALSDELSSVTTVHKAGFIISEEEARSLESNPEVEVLRVPGKVVASIKPPFKRKARFVACGNYLTRPKESKSPTLDRHDLYSAGLDSFALRTQLAIGAYKRWHCASLDVKTAFLTAPLQQPRATSKTGKERIVLVRVPRVMVLAGLVPPGSWMRVEGALYGLQESPHSWGNFRDGKLQCLTWRTPSGKKVFLEQCASDVSVWLIKSEGLVVGLCGSVLNQSMPANQVDFAFAVSKLKSAMVEYGFTNGITSSIYFLSIRT
ncbi:unnamed protein product [Symbiodinium necroappetens]|uniref:Integrase catalytic domain-containing protein n=1 Tax=Symbiodinium necroappetens TaxID=1628268 RepID=A0A812R4W7_9DINO|nr:unnamed protein product [Symbiodinium necroappetens]